MVEKREEEEEEEGQTCKIVMAERRKRIKKRKDQKMASWQGAIKWQKISFAQLMRWQFKEQSGEGNTQIKKQAANLVPKKPIYRWEIIRRIWRRKCDPNWKRKNRSNQ